MLTVGSLFSGCGLLDYGLHLAGLEHAWLCERDEFRAGLLARRWPGVPVYRDVRALADACEQGLEGRGVRGAAAERAGRVDLVVGGFPCKGVSSAGRREGFGHPETALWREMLRIVRALRPRYVLVENVAALLTLNGGELFGEVVGGLAEIGYDAEWDCFPAAAFGAPHRRDRVFVTAVADAGGERRQQDAGRAHGDEAAAARRAAEPDHEPRGASAGGIRAAWGEYEPAVERWERIVGRAAPQPLVRRVDDGSARRVDRSRLSALGDGVLVQAGWLVGRRIVEHAMSGAA